MDKPHQTIALLQQLQQLLEAGFPVDHVKKQAKEHLDALIASRHDLTAAIDATFMFIVSLQDKSD